MDENGQWDGQRNQQRDRQWDGQTQQGSTATDPWEVFRTRLEAYASTMIDPVDADVLVLHVPWAGAEEVGEVRLSLRDEATVLWVDYAWDGVGFRAEDPVSRTDLAQRLTETIRFRYCLPHPQLMTVSASGPAAGGVGVLGLAEHEQAGPPRSTGTPDVSWPQCPDELRSLVLGHLRSTGHPEADLDEDGDILVVVDGSALWVRTEDDCPVLHLFTQVVDGVCSRRQAGIELNVVNRAYRWSRWVRHDRQIWQGLHVPARPFVPALLDTMLAGFVGDLQRVQGDLADRLGGKACR